MAQQHEGAVVVGVGGSSKDSRALDCAAEEATRRGRGVHLIYAFRFAKYNEGLTLDIDEHGRMVTGPAVERIRSTHPDLQVTAETRVDEPAVALVDASAWASVVVVGSRGLGQVAGRMLGSVSQKVAAHARGPVVVVRDTAGAPEGPVVVGVDPADVVPAVVDFAAEQARDRGVGLRLVYARAPLPSEVGSTRVRSMLIEAATEQAEALETWAHQLTERYPGVPFESAELHGHPVQTLTKEAAQASLLVVGSRGRKGLARLLLGSVTLGVLHEAPVVAVVRVRV